ncbi:MAG TPA: hypothetical protein GX529_06995 [Firmicutes bacterium]|nr:hypothetical protein [Candidatus Fermentithermobacillaceae bacterium]
MRREVPAVLTTVMAIFVFLSAMLFPLEEMKILARTDSLLQFMGNMALFLGGINLFRLHSRNIKKKREYWPFSLWLLAVFVFFTVLGIVKGNNDPLYKGLYDALIVPVNASMHSISAFFLCSAAFKAFRIKNLDSIVLMISAVWVMLASVPIGEIISPNVGIVKDWLLAVPGSAVARAMANGLFLAGFAATLRIFLGLERRHLGQ